MEALQADDPTLVGRFRVVGRLGVGGMGRVYAATAPDGRRAAVKVIRDDLADEEHHIDYIETNLELMDRLGEQLYLAQLVDQPPTPG